ncbi:MAG: methyl-accepting chemotaxis protein [Lachnospiraceae bacterium]|nr:methyl-accepting chemotaxis protein [Lachnospiraceae bacterium]
MKNKQRSIIKHLRQNIIIGIIIICLAIELGSIFSINKELTADTEEQVILEAASEAKYVEAWLSKKISETELIAEAVSVMDDLSDTNVSDYLTKSVARDSDVLNWYLCRENLKYVVYNGGTFDLDPTERAWWTEAWSKNATIVTDAYVDANTGAIVVSVATPFYLKGNIKSVILADITMDTLVKTLTNIDNENISIFMTASDGTIILHNNEDYCMKPDGSTTSVKDISNIDIKKDEVQSYKDENGDTNLLSLKSISQNGWLVGVYIADSYRISRILKVVLFILLAGVIVATGAIISFIFLLKQQLAPMNEMKSFVKNAVVGEENVPFFKKEKAEIAFLINELREKFIETIRKTKSEMGNIDDSVQGTITSVSTMSDTVTDISLVIEKTVASLETQTNSINNINADCATISNASQVVAQQAQEMAYKASEIVESVNKLAPKMQADKDAIRKGNEASRCRLEAAIAQAECIKEITSISNAIQQIASQTKLLSLNASIESARAGESGRGFAVVADEIRSLSEETGAEINKITELTRTLLDAVDALSKESTNSMKNQANDIAKAYEIIDNLAAEYKSSAEYYANISADLGANSQELSASVEAVAASVAEITESQRGVNDAMNTANSNIQSMVTDADSLKSSVEDVLKSVGEVSGNIKQFNV